MKILKWLAGGINWLLIVIVLLVVNALGGMIPGVPDNWLWKLLGDQVFAFLKTFWWLILLGFIILIFAKSKDARDYTYAFAVTNPKAAGFIAAGIVGFFILAAVWQPLLVFLSEWWYVLLPISIAGLVIAGIETNLIEKLSPKPTRMGDPDVTDYQSLDYE